VINISEAVNMVIFILVFFLILGLVVFVHEFGHFIMARRCGIFVEEFAMGMGPKILTFKGKKRSKTPREGEEEVTLYTLRALPIGGFCKMRGMEEHIPDDPEAMNNKSVFDRILVIVGGSAMNFLLALIIFFALNFIYGYTTLVVTHVADASPAQQAGLQVGDRITHANDSRVSLWENFIFVRDMNGTNPMDMRIIRDGQRISLTIVPQEINDGEYRLGFAPTHMVGRRITIPEGFTDYERASFIGSLTTSVNLIDFHIRTPFRLLTRFVTRQTLPEGVGVQSVIGIGAQVLEVYQETMQLEQNAIETTILFMVSVTALISVAIGIMNLLPIPALDGARLMFLIIEGIRKKPVSQEREGTVHMVGFVILMVLFVVVASRDIFNIIR